MQLHKIYNSAIASAVQNINIIPPSKRIEVLSDITVQYYDQQIIPSTSSLRKIRKSKKSDVKQLADVKGNWENQTFVNTYQKGGHNQEFLRFINNIQSIPEK
jgi:hypothetical protein